MRVWGLGRYRRVRKRLIALSRNHTLGPTDTRVLHEVLRPALRLALTTISHAEIYHNDHISCKNETDTHTQMHAHTHKPSHLSRSYTLLYCGSKPCDFTWSPFPPTWNGFLSCLQNSFCTILSIQTPKNVVRSPKSWMPARTTKQQVFLRTRVQTVKKSVDVPNSIGCVQITLIYFNQMRNIEYFHQPTCCYIVSFP